MLADLDAGSVSSYARPVAVFSDTSAIASIVSASPLTGTYQSGLVLSNPAYNPVTVTGSIDVSAGTALTGAAGTAWNIVNQNLSSRAAMPAPQASASASHPAVASPTRRAGHRHNTNTSGGAIYISGDVGSVTNAGSINNGVWLQAGGGVSNLTGGKIVSGNTNGYAVGFHAGGTLVNAGLMSGLLLTRYRNSPRRFG